MTLHIADPNLRRITIPIDRAPAVQDSVSRAWCSGQAVDDRMQFRIAGSVQLSLGTPHHTLQKLAGFRHDEAKTIEIEQDIEKFLSLEMRHRVGELPAFAQCRDQILARLLPALKNISIELAHWDTSNARGGRVHPSPK
jgi:hypothetical protein